MSKQNRARTRAIRDYAFETQKRYAEAARELDQLGNAGCPFQL